MFLCVVLQILPQVVGKRIFVRHVGVENAGELRPFGWEFWEFERAARLEPDEEDALAVLRHDALRVDDSRIHLITEFVFQNLHDDLERVSLVMPNEVLHVLQYESRRLVVFENVPDGEEEVALFHVVEAVLATEAVLLGDARKTEGLAGKAPAQDIELWDIRYYDGIDIAMRLFTKVGLVGQPTELIPIAGKNALRTGALEGKPEPADATEQIDEAGGFLAGLAIDAIRRQIFSNHYPPSFLASSPTDFLGSLWHCGSGRTCRRAIRRFSTGFDLKD